MAIKHETRLQKARAYHIFLKEMREGTDRATAIIAGSYLDVMLEELLRTFFVDPEGNAKALEALLAQERPLSTFGAKIHLAYCLGLLTRSEYHDLKLIKDIRNEFAHSVGERAFTDADITSKCESLALPKQQPEFSEKGIDSRHLYQAATIVLRQQIELRVVNFHIPGPEKRREPWPEGVTFRLDPRLAKKIFGRG